MSLSQFPLGVPALAQTLSETSTDKKAPSKRTATALGDRKAVPEPR